MNKRAQGEAYESEAARHLEAQGLTLLQTNYHCKQGEIDLIMRDQKKSLVFVEVRYRKNSSFGGAAMSITPAKQRKIALAALHYLQTSKQPEAICRFDAVTVSATGMQWIKDAFHSPL